LGDRRAQGHAARWISPVSPAAGEFGRADDPVVSPVTENLAARELGSPRTLTH
jgi:hypothetical protein